MNLLNLTLYQEILENKIIGKKFAKKNKFV